MSFFKNLFGRKSDNSKPGHPEPEMTAEMLDEEIFWAVIEDSLKNSNSQDKQEAFLIKALSKLPPKDIIGFRLRTDKLLYDTYNSEMWCAAYIVNGGCSDDMFEYFRTWPISRGKDVFYDVKKNPDNLINHLEGASDEDYYDFESFWYVALAAFEQTTGKELYDYIDDSFTTSEGNYPAIEFNWEEENPESMKAICPRLYERFLR